MSEVKDEEEMVEQSSSDSSDDEQLIDAEVGVGESSQPVEKQIVVENGGTPAPPSEATSEDNRNVESAEVEGSAEPSPESNADGATPVDAAVADKSKSEGVDKVEPLIQPGDTTARDGILEPKVEEEVGVESKDDVSAEEVVPVPEENGVPEDTPMKQDVGGEEYPVHSEVTNQTFLVEPHMNDGDESGSEEEQAAFMKELESFFKERSMEFKPPKFYGEGLNCLKLWRGVTRLGGYDRVTACKLWRQVGESFKPPKTCTTVSWSFRIFYEKALLDYERHKLRGGELHLPIASISEPMNAEIQMGGPSTGSGRARRDAAARAMQGWHSQRLLGNGEVGDPIIKDKSCVSLSKREKPLKSVGLLKRKKASNLERTVKTARTMTKVAKPQMDSMVVDIGPPADWVKVNVRKTKDCFEVYALVPGLLREEVRVQSDPAGRLVISGDPEQPDNPWGVAPFKKVISLPSRIDPHQTSAVVTLHGQLFVRVPFEQSDL